MLPTLKLTPLLGTVQKIPTILIALFTQTQILKRPTRPQLQHTKMQLRRKGLLAKFALLIALEMVTVGLVIVTASKVSKGLIAP